MRNVCSNKSTNACCFKQYILNKNEKSNWMQGKWRNHINKKCDTAFHVVFLFNTVQMFGQSHLIRYITWKTCGAKCILLFIALSLLYIEQNLTYAVYNVYNTYIHITHTNTHFIVRVFSNIALNFSLVCFRSGWSGKHE